MSTYVSRQLTKERLPDRFGCGQPALNDWLRRAALRAQRQDTARTYVWTPPDHPQVVACYAATPTTVRRAEVSGSLSGGVSVIPPTCWRAGHWTASSMVRPGRGAAAGRTRGRRQGGGNGWRR